MAALVIGAIGCAHAYRADVTPMDGGRYMIRSAPDDEQVSESIALQYAQRRAAEVCPGGYETVDSRTGVAVSRERVAVFGRRTTEYPEVTITIRCNGQGAPR